MCDLCQNVRPLPSHLDLFKVVRSRTLKEPYLPIATKVVFLGLSWGSETEYVVQFSHRPANGLLTVPDVNQGN